MGYKAVTSGGGAIGLWRGEHSLCLQFQRCFLLSPREKGFEIIMRGRQAYDGGQNAIANQASPRAALDLSAAIAGKLRSVLKKGCVITPLRVFP